MSYHPITRSTQCRTENTNQPAGDGCHACYRGVMQAILLPPVGHLRKMSTAMCATVFDDLEMALRLLEAGSNQFNPIQRELASRFVLTCKTFARDMLAAEGNSNALRMLFGLLPDEAR